MEYEYGATLGKMAVGIKVVGHQFQKVTLKEELRRVSFYIVPNIIQQVLTLKVYFSDQLNSIKHYKDYNDFIVSTNPALYILNIIVIVDHVSRSGDENRGGGKKKKPVAKYTFWIDQRPCGNILRKANDHQIPKPCQPQ